MEKRLLLSLLFCILSIPSFAQSDWFYHNNDNVDIHDLTNDSNGNSYIIGKGNVVFGNNTVQGIYVAKFDSIGTIEWTKTMNSTYTGHLSTLDAKYLAVNAQQELYFVNAYYPTDTINGNVFNQYPTNHWYIGKLDINGNYLWTKEIPINEPTGAFNVDIDENGDFYTITQAGFKLYFQKYDGTNGNLIWEKQWQFNNNNQLDIHDMDCDRNGDCYITGEFNGSISLLNDTTITSVYSSKDVLLVQYDSSGTRQWMKNFASSSNGDERGTALALGSEYLYLSIEYGNSFVVDGVLFDASFTSSIVKVKKDNGQFKWAKGTSLEPADDITLDDDENIYFVGNNDPFNTSDFFIIDTFRYEISDSMGYGFDWDAILRLDSSGNFMDLRKFAFSNHPFTLGARINDIAVVNNRLITVGIADNFYTQDSAITLNVGGLNAQGYIYSIPLQKHTIEIDSIIHNLGCNSLNRKLYSTTSKHHYDNNFYVELSNNYGSFSIPISSINSKLPIDFSIERTLDSMEFYPHGNNFKHRVRVCATSPVHCSASFPIGLIKIKSEPIINLCLGDTIELSASNALSHHWYNSNFSDTSSTTTVSPDSTIYVYLDALTSNGCVMTDSVLINVIELHIPDLIDTISVKCNDISPGVAVPSSTTVGGSGNYSYQWFPSTNVLNANTSQPTFSRNILDLNYYVSVFDSSYQCNIQDSLFLTSDSCNVIKGIIQKDSLNPLQVSTVELYKGNTTLDSLIKTTQTDINGQYEFTTSDTNVVIKVSPLNSLYPFELTTFYDSAFLKQDATPISIVSDTTYLSFYTLSPSDSIGNITLSGQIFYFDNPSLPVSNLNIKLVETNSQLPINIQNINNIIVREARTDSDGVFVFDDLPAGSYELWGDSSIFNNLIAPSFQVTATSNTIFYLKDSILMPCAPHTNSDCVLISGSIYFDADSNCVQSNSEIIYPNYPVVIEPGPIYLSTDSTGYYYAIAILDTFTVKTRLPYSYYWQETCTDLSYEFAIDTISTKTVQADFGFSPLAYLEDGKTNMTAYTPARPGFDTDVNVSYRNIGALELHNVTLVLHHDTSLVYVSQSQAQPPSFIGNNRIEWFFNKLDVGQAGSIGITFNLTPDVNLLGSNLTYISELIPTPNEQTIPDNSDTAQITITGSYDPNDKQVSPSYGEAGQILEDTEQLIYTIRFQNTGTDTAFKVVIIDTLEAQLDPLSLHTISTSHPYTFNLSENGIAKWTFDNILLPDSTTNLIGSNGFVKFEINFMDTLKIGDTIQNQAAIYFDFNPPIFTNTVMSSVVEEIIFINTYETLKTTELPVKIYPNPANSHIIITMQGYLKEELNIEIFDILGRQKLQLFTKNQLQEINLNDFPTGVYYLKIQTQSGNYSIRKFIKN